MRVSKVSLWHLRPSSDARPRVLSWTRGGEEVGITLEGGAEGGRLRTVMEGGWDWHGWTDTQMTRIDRSAEESRGAEASPEEALSD